MQVYVAPEMEIMEMRTDTSFLLLVSGDDSEISDLEDCIIG